MARIFTVVSCSLLGIFLIVCVFIWVGTTANSVAFLAGAEKHGTFMPVSYSWSCTTKASCEHTDGFVEGTGERLTWPDVVPLGQPFTISLPYTRWLGLALVVQDKGNAITDLVFSLLIELLQAAVGSFFLWSAWDRASRVHA